MKETDQAHTVPPGRYGLNEKWSLMYPPRREILHRPSATRSADAATQALDAVPDIPSKGCAAMKLIHFATLPVIVTALLVVAAVSKTSAGEMDKLEARFEIFGFGGLHVLTNRTTVEESKDRYSIAMDLDTRGVARVFVDLTSHSEVHGRLGTNTARPEAYRAEVRRNGTDRHYAVDYRGDGAVINASMPPRVGKPLLTSVEQIRSTVDQLTAYFILERQLAQSGRCALVVPVFDGSGLYNVRFTDIKPETLSADGHQNFTGPTRLCEVVREEIRIDQDGDTYRRGRIWYARLTASDLMLPVRMEFDTAFGTVKGYLAELSEGSVHLRLAPE